MIAEQKNAKTIYPMMNNDIIQRAVHPNASHMQGITLQTEDCTLIYLTPKQRKIFKQNWVGISILELTCRLASSFHSLSLLKKKMLISTK